MKFKLKDPGSAITHGIGMLLAVVGATPLIVKAARSADVLHVFAVSVFILTMILLYLASTLYHSVNSTAKVNRRLKKMDHMMIFVMIAGSYTPVCLIVLHGRTGYILCALVWTVAIIGMILKGCWINCPKMAFLCDLHWNGLAVCTCFCSDLPQSAPCRLRMAPCRRHHLYHRRCDLCAEASDLQCEA